MKEKVKKALFIATVDSHIVSFHIPYLKMLQEEGFKTYVATGESGEIPNCNHHFTLHMKRRPFSVWNLYSILELKKILKQEHFDIIHCHTPVGGVVARIAARQSRRKGTRVIYTAHGFHFYKGAPIINWLLFYPVEKYLAKYTDTLITINQEDYDRAKRNFSKRCKDIQYMPGMGVDPEKFDIKINQSEQKKIRASLGLSDTDFVIIYVARLDKNKNQGFAIDAISQLINEHPDIHLLLVGNDELRGKYQKQAHALNLDNNIHFLGHRNDIPELLRISNLAISTSCREGLPMNIMEAMYVGLPIVAIKCRGVRSLVINNKNGYLVKDGDNNTFRRLVEKVYTNQIIRNNFSEENRETSSSFLLQARLLQMRDIYFRKNRVLHLLSTNKYSGAENVACQIMNLFKAEKNYDMIYCSPGGAIKKTIEDKGLKYLDIEKITPKNVRKILANEDINIIHAHDIRASFAAALAARKKQITVISHVHDNHIGMRRPSLKSMGYAMVAKKFRHIFWVSQSCLDNYVFRKQVLGKSSVLRNVIDGREIMKKAREAEKSKPYQIVFIGRLTDAKDPMRVLSIMQTCVSMNSKLRCGVIGCGAYYNKMKEYVDEYGLDKRIELLGFLDNPYGILRNASVLLMASKHEGLPMVVLEALSFGIPVVSTPTDGVLEVIKNGENGFLSNDDRILAKKCIEYVVGEKSKFIKDNAARYLQDYHDAVKEVYES